MGLSFSSSCIEMITVIFLLLVVNGEQNYIPCNEYSGAAILGS